VKKKIRPIYIRYSTSDLMIFVLRTWRAQGWAPRLLLPGMSKPKGRVISPTDINVSFKRGPYRVRRYGSPGWQKAKIVRFSSAADVLASGLASDASATA
jgi:hypothetical protein